MSSKLMVETGGLVNGMSHRFEEATGKIFKFNGTEASGAIKWVEVTTEADKKLALSALVRDAKADPANLNQGARKWLSEHLAKDQFKNVFASSSAAEKAMLDSLTHISEAIKFADSQVGVNFNLDVLKQGILNHGELGEKLLSPATIAEAEKAGFKLADMASLRKDCETLKGLLKITPGKPVDIKAIRTILINNHEHATQLVTAVGTGADTHLIANHSGSLADIASKIKTDIATAESDLRTGIQTVKERSANLKMLENNKMEQAAIDVAKKELTEATESVSKLLGKEEGRAALKAVHADKGFEETMTEVRKLVPELDKHAKGVASKAADMAKDGGFFTKKGAELTSYTEKELQGVGGFWRKRTFAGKAGIVAGIAAVTYAVVSAIGGKGPGENVDRVRSSQAEPATGAAR